jgi:hypothetical protein
MKYQDARRLFGDQPKWHWRQLQLGETRDKDRNRNNSRADSAIRAERKRKAHGDPLEFSKLKFK